MPPPPIVSIIAKIVRADAHTAATDINVNALGAGKSYQSEARRAQAGTPSLKLWLKI
jgi:hypothetical protein